MRAAVMQDPVVVPPPPTHSDQVDSGARVQGSIEKEDDERKLLFYEF